MNDGVVGEMRVAWVMQHSWSSRVLGKRKKKKGKDKVKEKESTSSYHRDQSIE